MLIDVHAHIHQHDSAEHADIVTRAVTAGVDEIVVAGTSVDDSLAAIDMAKRFDSVSAAVGIHPDAIHSPVPQHDIDTLDELAGDPSVVAMSEIGIDAMRGDLANGHQQAAFEAEIEIAKRRGLPVIVHVREDADDLTRWEARDTALGILAACDVGTVGGTMHYFQGSCEYAQRVLDLGMHISLAKPLLRISELQEVARKVPADRIVLESDSYPQPFKRNRDKWTEPRDVRAIAQFLAELRGTTIDDIAEQTTRNARQLLRRSSS